jgi:hypothetical protein
MLAVRSFLVEMAPRVRRVLRRYQGLELGWRCGPRQRHEANATLDEVHQALDDPRRIHAEPDVSDYDGWPDRCECAACPVEGRYVFKPGDMRAVMHERLGVRTDTGETVLFYMPPPGAVMDWTVYHPWSHYPALDRRYQAPPPDGRGIVIGLPDGGLWWVDRLGDQGERWARSGELDRLTVTQTAGPASRWTLVDGTLAAADAAVSGQERAA